MSEVIEEITGRIEKLYGKVNYEISVGCISTYVASRSVSMGIT